MRMVIRAAGVAAAALVLLAAPSTGRDASAASRSRARTCTAGSTRWLETWRQSYVGKVVVPTAVYRRPGRDPFSRLELGDRYGFQTAVPIVAERLGRRCEATWFRVRLAIFPNGTLGWIRASTVATSRLRTRIVVDISRRRLFLLRHGRVALSTAAAVGKPGTPTPLGRFYVTQRFVVTNPTGPFGSRALGISAFSEVLRSWRDGGPVGIHGTSEPFSIGQPVSHGCVRLPERAMVSLFERTPLGTPVIVRP